MRSFGHVSRSGHIAALRVGVIALLLAIPVAACGAPAGVLFQTELPTVNQDPLPVVLGDSTGLVTAIEPAEFDPWPVNEPRVQADPADPNAFILTWTGGLCDSDAAVSFSRSDSAYALHLVVRGKPGLGCPAAGVPRGLRIVTGSPISVGSIVVSGGG